MDTLSDCKSAHPGSIPGVASTKSRKNMEENDAQNAERETNAERAGTKTGTMNIYVMEMECGAYKIGMSNDPEQRLREVRTGSPFPVTLLGTAQVSRRHAPRIERHLHGVYQERRLEGEWFCLPENRTPRSFAKQVILLAKLFERCEQKLI